MSHTAQLSLSPRPFEGDRQRRELAEAALARSEETFRLLVEAVQDYAIFMLDPSGYILTWNAGAERLKGYRAAEAIGSHFSRFYTAYDVNRGHPDEELRQAAAVGRYEEEGWRIRKDGSRFWASVTLTALRDAEGRLRGFGKVTRDLTERKAAEDALLAANESLEQRVKARTAELQEAIMARDKFLSIASHELKTPLTSLSLQTQLKKWNLRRGDLRDFAPEKLPQLLDDEERQIKRLIYLVEDMLDVSRLARGRFQLHREEFDLVDLAREVKKRLLPQYERQCVRLHLDTPPSLRGIWDRYRLDQVLSNLLSNALKYGAQHPVQLRITDDERQTCIEVIDRGEGIAAADQERIFESFERLADDGLGGLGLGLYITKQIVTLHGGTIRVQSKRGQGSVFTVALPKPPV